MGRTCPGAIFIPEIPCLLIYIISITTAFYAQRCKGQNNNNNKMRRWKYILYFKKVRRMWAVEIGNQK